jgi:hypothetical protein
MMMLFMTIYIFAILGCNLFGANDPAHFGGVTVAMMALFQVSTLGSWSKIAYISFFGCKEYLHSPYDQSNPSRVHTMAGVFVGYKCDRNEPNPVAAALFWPLYLVIASWVIMVSVSA